MKFSTDGVTWTRKTFSGGFYGGIAFGDDGFAIPSMSWDGGETFVTADGCPSIDYGGIGGEGGVAVGDGNLVLVSGNGEYCHVTDKGRCTRDRFVAVFDARIPARLWV